MFDCAWLSLLETDGWHARSILFAKHKMEVFAQFVRVQYFVE